MVKKIMVLFVVFTMFSACENSEGDCDYTDCYPYEPYEDNMSISLTINQENDSVPIWIYEGKYNDNNSLIFADTATENTYHIILPLNQQYYVKAKYKKGNKIIYAIDGTYFKKYDHGACDSTCWKVKNNRLDVRLKNR